MAERYRGGLVFLSSPPRCHFACRRSNLIHSRSGSNVTKSQKCCLGWIFSNFYIQLS
ncbi:hypothetical protein TELCIR_19297 [Teladorsagia circumcincta]|uniref:Uncharacterized protein n=1 Tax=Teladorsagia circumcincta TaxID=45464 RepID=A0A2G9TMM0_TELCI|nr:hypothetical protein TELCIR_19297 [Teladorsagia circumcincta]